MDLGLIIPEKKGGQYDFDLRCQKDLDDILTFKGMGFTLNEIRSVFYYKRLARLTPYQENQYYRDFFENKLKKVIHEIEQLKHTKECLKEKLIQLSEGENSPRFKLGVDIKALKLLKCMNCGGDMVLSEGNISNNQVINGKMLCDCGEKYEIDDGILLVQQKPHTDKPGYGYEHIMDYINQTSPEYLDKVYKGLEWIYKKLDFTSFNNKVIMDLGSGIGFCLRHLYNDLPDTSLYIAVDHDLSLHRFLKGVLETADVKKNVLFLCSDFLKIPVKDKSIDVVLDFSGTSNYSFENEGFLLELIDHYIKDDAFLAGTYILFKKFRFGHPLEIRYRRGFELKNVKEGIGRLKYKPIDEGISDMVKEGGKYEDYFKDGDEVYSYAFYGKR